MERVVLVKPTFDCFFGISRITVHLNIHLAQPLYQGQNMADVSAA